MNRFLPIALLMAFTQVTLAQRARTGRNPQMKCLAVYAKHKLGKSDRYTVHQFATARFLHPNDQYSTLKLTHHTSSKTGEHYLFHQYLSGIRLLDHFVKVNCSKDGVVLSVFHNTYHCKVTPPLHRLNSKTSTTLLLDHFEKAITVNGIDAVYVMIDDQLSAANLIDHTPGNCQHMHSIVQESGVLNHRDMIEYFDGDTLIRVKVFNPDPLTSAGQYYGGGYTDNNDADASTLNNQRVTDTCTGNYSAGNFTLANAFVTIAEHSPPVTTIPTLPVDSFFYMRSESGFEDANAFYHISRIKQHINKLGYNTLVNYQIRVDAHGLNGTDNSTFNSGPNPPELTYGEGGVDDAEDADVIVHEYTHAISHSAAPGTNSGTERQNLEEANCDYIATSYSRNINPFRWQDVYTWDGHNEYWNGRSALTTKSYAAVTFGGNIYEHTDLWCGVLMELWSDLGRDLNDKLLLESMYSYAPGMSMQDAAHLFVLADSTLYGGANYWKICPRFFNRGLLTTCTTLDVKTLGAKETVKLIPNPSTGQTSLLLSLDQNQRVAVEVYASNGQRVHHTTLVVNLGSNKIELATRLPGGIYFVKITTMNSSITRKWIVN